MNDFWRRLLELERRQLLTARGQEESVNRSKQLSNQVQNLLNLTTNPIERYQSWPAQYPFAFDGIWISAQFDSVAPTLYNSRKCYAANIYDRTEQWMGYNPGNAGSWSSPYLAQNYPFTISTGVSAVYGCSELATSYTAPSVSDSYVYSVLNPGSIAFDSATGKLRIRASISAMDVSVHTYQNIYWKSGFGPTGRDLNVPVYESIDVSCDHYLTISADNLPFSGNSGSITVPGVVSQRRINTSGLPLVIISDPYPNTYPDQWFNAFNPALIGYPYNTHWPSGTNPNQQCDAPGTLGSWYCTSGPATFTIRWDSPSAACMDGNPSTACVYQHWDEY